jgi:hypothetical protein
MSANLIMPTNEQIIQFEGNVVLTNKGRMFKRLISANFKENWVEIKTPNFEDNE